MQHLKNLVSVQYLFTVTLGALSQSDKEFFLIGAIALVLAIILKIAAMYAPTPVDKKYRNSFFSLLLFVGIWELIWFFCRSEYARFFGTHFVALLGLLIAAVWLVWLLVKMVKEYSSEKQIWEKEQVRLKYLPR